LKQPENGSKRPSYRVSSYVASGIALAIILTHVLLLKPPNQSFYTFIDGSYWYIMECLGTGIVLYLVALYFYTWALETYLLVDHGRPLFLRSVERPRRKSARRAATRPMIVWVAATAGGIIGFTLMMHRPGDQIGTFVVHPLLTLGLFTVVPLVYTLSIERYLLVDGGKPMTVRLPEAPDPGHIIVPETGAHYLPPMDS
jgi:hypothetical protein